MTRRTPGHYRVPALHINGGGMATREGRVARGDLTPGLPQNGT
jgi:hypothetical protein